MSNICKNCNFETDGKFCSNCGQSTSTKKIDWSFCFKEFIFNNFTFHKGMLFTIKSLILNPKKMVENYLAGKRIRYTGAVQFFLFILIFKGIISLLVGDVGPEKPGTITANDDSSQLDMQSYIRPMLFIFVTISSLGNYLVYKSRKFSLAEHFVLNFYIIGMCFFLTQVFDLITFNKIQDWNILIMALIVISYYIRIFYDKKIRVVDFLKGIWCMAVNFIFATIVVISGAFIYLYQHGMLYDMLHNLSFSQWW
jgi:hypothetical protein